MIREVNVKEITENIKEMCIEANYTLSPDMDKAMKKAAEEEKSELGTKILNQLQENLVIADSEKIPICQDTGMAVVFVDIGQEIPPELYQAVAEILAMVYNMREK